MESRISTLGESATFSSGGTPSKARSDYWSGDIPWVSAKDMKSSRIYESEDHVTALGARNGTRIAAKNATLLLVRGMTLHNEVPICLVMRDVTFNQDVKALIAKDHVDSNFLYYYLIANKSKLLAMVDSAGHGTGRLNTDQLKSLEIKIPDKKTQHRIASVFIEIDDKIELNRRMNETLEGMVQALFKSWFVNFDPVHAKAAGQRPEGMDAETAGLFPNSIQDSPLGKIPKGWSAGNLSEMCSKITDGSHQSPRSLSRVCQWRPSKT